MTSRIIDESVDDLGVVGSGLAAIAQEIPRRMWRQLGRGAAYAGSMSEETPSQTADMNDNAAEDRAQDLASNETLGGDGGPSGAEKDPSDWVTGDEPMTGSQRSYLDTLAREAGEELDADMTKAEASQHIDRLQDKTGRGDT